MTEPQDPTDLPAVAARLIKTIDDLTKSIHELLERTAKSERQTRWQWVVIAAIAVLFAGGGLMAYQQLQTDRTLAETRGDVLCPIYAVWLGAYNPSSRAPGPDRTTYEATYVVMRDGYNRLGCTNPLVPPPTTRPDPPR